MDKEYVRIDVTSLILPLQIHIYFYIYFYTDFYVLNLISVKLSEFQISIYFKCFQISINFNY